jgi:hypothetical protein
MSKTVMIKKAEVIATMCRALCDKAPDSVLAILDQHDPFLEYTPNHPQVLADVYLKRWHKAAKTVVSSI